MATTHAEPSATVPRKPVPMLGKHGKPAAMVRFGSASVPVYRCGSGGRVRFAISHYRDGKRLRQFFPTLEAAKKEAQLVAQRIQAGMQHVTDLKPHERDNYAKAVELLGSLNIPLVAAVEDYVQARELAESESLTALATAYRKFFKPLTRRVTGHPARAGWTLKTGGLSQGGQDVSIKEDGLRTMWAGEFHLKTGSKWFQCGWQSKIPQS
ncbi:MAG: hypothetical protein NTW21_05365 [Verrucomicrobia bacterium]|nr:hypothetical protein [Verrucomicrobiota bacterium]